jgi:hypothetical protein
VDVASNKAVHNFSRELKSCLQLGNVFEVAGADPAGFFNNLRSIEAWQTYPNATFTISRHFAGRLSGASITRNSQPITR